MEPTKEQTEVLGRLGRIAGIHGVMNKEAGTQRPATILATVSATTSALIQSWLNARDPINILQERDGVTRQIGSCFIILIHLCGSLNLDALTVIDEEFARQVAGLEVQRAAMRAMQSEIDKQKKYDPSLRSA